MKAKGWANGASAKEARHLKMTAIPKDIKTRKRKLRSRRVKCCCRSKPKSMPLRKTLIPMNCGSIRTA